MAGGFVETGFADVGGSDPLIAPFVLGLFGPVFQFVFNNLAFWQPQN